MSRRYARNHDPYVPPVRRVQLSEDSLILRIVVLCVVLAIAVGAFGYAIKTLLAPQLGWQEVEAANPKTGIAQQFVLQYNLGAGEMDATEERRQVALIYSDTLDNAYELLSSHEVEHVINLHYLNTHPNEIVGVDPILYHALETAATERILYIGPLTEYYTGLYNCTQDNEAEAMDPYRNTEVSAFAAEVSAFAMDPAHIELELLPESRVCLHVSEEYLAYAAENEILSFIDLFWLRNAFILDAAADALTEQGLTNGMLSSCDGFSRTMSDVKSSTNIFEQINGELRQNAVLETAEQQAMVSFRAFPTSKMEDGFYYSYADGVVRTPFVNPVTGLMRSAAGSLTVYSGEYSCGELASMFYSAFAAEEPVAAGEHTHGVSYADGVLTVTDPTVILTNVRPGVTVK